MRHESPPYPSSVVFQTVFIFFLSTPNMLTHTNLNHLFSFSPYLYSRKKNTKIVKSQNDKTTKKNTLTHNNKTRGTSHFPKSSPENHRNDHQNHHRSKQLKPGEPLVPYPALSDFPNPSPKTRVVDSGSSRADFPNSSPTSPHTHPPAFPKVVTFHSPNWSPAEMRSDYWFLYGVLLLLLVQIQHTIYHQTMRI